MLDENVRRRRLTLNGEFAAPTVWRLAEVFPRVIVGLHQLRRCTLQSRILPLEILQPTRLVHFQLSTLGAPPLETRLG